MERLQGAVAALVFYYFIRVFLVFWFKQQRAIARWYKGLPPRQWFGMMLIISGLKITDMKHCKVKRFDDRLWISPKTFIDKELEEFVP